MPRLLDLPNELLIEIATCCGPQRLGTLARCCKLLYIVANPILYGFGPNRGFSRKAHVRFYHTLLRRPSLAKHCKDLTLRSRTWSYTHHRAEVMRFDQMARDRMMDGLGPETWPNCPTLVVEFFRVVSLALSFAENLRSLQCHPDWFCARGLDALSLRSLKILRIWAPHTGLRTEVSPWVFKDIASLPALSDLGFFGCSLLFLDSLMPTKPFSSLRALSLFECELANIELGSLLSDLPAGLESFRYSCRLQLPGDAFGKLFTGGFGAVFGKHVASLRFLSIRVNTLVDNLADLFRQQNALASFSWSEDQTLIFPKLELLSIEQVSTVPVLQEPPPYPAEKITDDCRAALQSLTPFSCHLDISYHVSQGHHPNLLYLGVANSEDHGDDQLETFRLTETLNDKDGDFEIVYHYNHVTFWPPVSKEQALVMKQRWRLNGRILTIDGIDEIKESHKYGALLHEAVPVQCTAVFDEEF